MTTDTVPSDIIIFNAPTAFKEELVDRLESHINDEVDALLECGGFQVSMGMADMDHREYRERMLQYVRNYLSIFIK